MSWRVLELSEQPDGERIPQLLVKPVFGPDSYTVHLTCLSNIWSEELDLDGILNRALQEQSPIEVSRQDTAQLAVLLEKIKKSLENSDDAVCRITRSDNNALSLQTSISLPAPLDSLTWKFDLVQRASTTLKNELILPLLVSSHIQHERLASLVSTIIEKDKAINRLVDQFESSNLDLASAFPIISSLKSGRKGVKREQAAKHIPALQPFGEEAFNQKTAQLVDSHVNTLGLFQEALSECTPSVPPQLKADDSDREWWTTVPARLSAPSAPAKTKARKSAPVASLSKGTADPSDDETEDDFETHANFKVRVVGESRIRLLTTSQTRNQDAAPIDMRKPLTAPASKPKSETSDTDTAEEDDDLDAPPKSQSQRSSQPTRKPPPRAKSSSPEHLFPPKAKGFRIGRRAKKASEEPLPSRTSEYLSVEATPNIDDVPADDSPPTANAEIPRKAKRNFKIGGKGKGSEPVPSMADRTRATHSPSVQPRSSPRPAKEETPEVEEEYEETPEEKAERRRAELKRKTEEAAKKGAQSKKKRRF